MLIEDKSPEVEMEENRELLMWSVAPESKTKVIGYDVWEKRAKELLVCVAKAMVLEDWCPTKTIESQNRESRVALEGLRKKQILRKDLCNILSVKSLTM